MKLGETEYTIGEIDATTFIKLTKFVSKVFRDIGEDKEEANLAEVVRGGFDSFLNVLSPLHLYELTAILLGTTKDVVRESWTLIAFTELLAELAEHNDLGALLKNLQRVVASLEL